MKSSFFPHSLISNVFSILKINVTNPSRREKSQVFAECPQAFVNGRKRYRPFWFTNAWDHVTMVPIYVDPFVHSLHEHSPLSELSASVLHMPGDTKQETSKYMQHIQKYQQSNTSCIVFVVSIFIFSLHKEIEKFIFAWRCGKEQNKRRRYKASTHAVQSCFDPKSPLPADAVLPSARVVHSSPHQSSHYSQAIEGRSLDAEYVSAQLKHIACDARIKCWWSCAVRFT